MSISIPAIIDSQLAALQAEMRPVQDAATKTQSFAAAPGASANRIGDLLELLTDLIDSGTLTETAGGSDAQLTDLGAFTGVNSLVGATFTFDAATSTAALQGVSRTVISNTTDVIVFDRALPANTAVGDVGVLTFTTIDKDLEALKQGKGLGDTASNPYGPGPSMINALVVLIEQLGGTLPPYLDPAAPEAEPFGLGSPHGGHGGPYGHGGMIMLADALQVARDTVAAYTAPA